MKLHKLRFSNLNSLQGTWEIDFASEALLNEGIFLITGPTGAGKSTILDAICLALYGRTPRLGKISKSKNEIISRGASECFAQLSFSARDGQLYQVRWRQRTARSSGRLQEPERELSLRGKILAAKINEVEEQIPLISGLEYEQFLRSILLAQGDFAAFMEASSNERAEILEKITGTAIYREISKLCFQRSKEVRDELQLWEERQNMLLPLEEEQRHELEGQVGAAQGQLQQIDAQQNKFAKLFQHYQTLEQLCREQLQLEQGITALPDYSHDQQRLTRNAEAQNLEPLYQKWQQNLEQLSGKRGLIGQQNGKQIEREQQLQNLSTDLVEADKSYQSSQELQRCFTKRREQLKELEWRSDENGKLISKQREQWTLSREQISELESSLKGQEEELETKREAIAYLNNGFLKFKKPEDLSYLARQLDELRQQLPAQAEAWRSQYRELADKVAGHEASSDYTLEIATKTQALEQLKNSELQLPTLELQPLPEMLQVKPTLEQREDIVNQAMDCCQRLISPLERYLLEYQHYGQNLRENREIAGEVEHQQEQLLKVELDLKKQEKELKTQERYCETLGQNLELHRHLLLFERERHKLQEGEACPLCGATEHSFKQVPAAPQDSQATQQELKKQEQLLVELQNAVQGDRDEVGNLRNRLEYSGQQAEKQHFEAIHLQTEVFEQGLLLWEILDKYSGTGFAPQALLPQLWQALQTQVDSLKVESPKQVGSSKNEELGIESFSMKDLPGNLSSESLPSESLPAGDLSLNLTMDLDNLELENLRTELSDCRKQLQEYRDTENQAFEQHQRQCEQLRTEHEQQIQDLEGQLAELKSQQHRAELQAKELQGCHKQLQDFYAKLRGDFKSLFSPYVQYLQGDESPIPEERELSEISVTEAPEERLLHIAASKALHTALEQKTLALQQTLAEWQALKEQIPLLEERIKFTVQKREALATENGKVEQQIAQNEGESAELQLSWREQISELFNQREPNGEPNGEPSPTENTEQIEEGIERQLQDSQQMREGLKSEFIELEKQLEVIRQMLANAKEECEALQQVYDEASRSWQKALSSSAFAEEEDFLAAKIAVPERLNLEEQIRDAEQERAQFENRMQELKRQVEGYFTQSSLDFEVSQEEVPELYAAEQRLRQTHEKTNSPSKGDETQQLANIQVLISKQIEQVKIQGNAMREELGAQKQRLDNDDDLRQKLQESVAQLRQKREQFKHWDLLNELIGDAKGNKYNRFAQQLSFEQLVYHANFYLEKVSDRYLLQSQAEHPLEFFVLDLYQLEGQSLRPSSNLSGGEKFLISLSLALALSKISAKKVPVQSLFLDEGFGTLDEEALHNTLEVLASLSNDGKLIGLISHISTLRERIMCQIQLESVGEGRSLIRCSGDIVQQISAPQKRERPKVPVQKRVELF